MELPDMTLFVNQRGENSKVGTIKGFCVEGNFINFLVILAMMEPFTAKKATGLEMLVVEGDEAQW